MTTDPRPQAPRRRLVVGTALVVGAALLAVGVWVGGRLSAAPPDPRAGASSAPSSPPPTPTVTDLYERVVGSMVVITTDANRLGSGVVANTAGEILTAAHVVDDARSIEVAFADGTETTAQVSAADEAADIATLVPDRLPETVVPVVFGGGAEVGAPVVAIGNPLGLAASVSTGVVSGLDRRADTADGTFSGLIQFDAAVNPGSSGGPLLDAGGRVIGIVISIADPGNDRSFAGIGFAVPIGAMLGGAGNGPEI